MPNVFGGAVITAAGQISDGIITTAKLVAGAIPISLLKSGSGTTTSAGAENVDTFAVSGLSANDTLLVFFNVESITAGTTTPLLYNVTDAVNMTSLFGNGNVGAGQAVPGHAVIRQAQTAATSVESISVSAATGGITIQTHAVRSAFTTAWTGSWTIAFRHGGVGAGGTYRWSWSIWRKIG